MIEILTDANKITINGRIFHLDDSGITNSTGTPATDKTIADFFEQHLGTVEYEGIVETIQTWYYGRLVKAPWCATSVSYFAHLAGMGDVVGKWENVNRMKEYLRNKDLIDATKQYLGGNYQAKRGDLVFLSSAHSYADCSHVGVVSEINHETGYLKVVSGNSKDSIRFDEYNYLTDKYVVCFGRMPY